MDIQKEREAFEEWIKNEDPFTGNDAAPDCIWAKKYMWKAWQAKAQAVPEGFVVLAIDDIERICRCLDDHAVYITYKASDSLENIQKAMIEAQEPK